MRLKIKTLTANMGAFTINQTYGAVSASRIGTRSLMNCLGIVLYNQVGQVGAIAHVEAQSDNAAYDRVANAALAIVLAQLNENGGGSGSLSLVLLGNRGPYKVKINLDLFGFRLAPATDFSDRRGQEGAFILDGAAGTLYLDALGNHIVDWAAPGVTTFTVQGA